MRGSRNSPPKLRNPIISAMPSHAEGILLHTVIINMGQNNRLPTNPYSNNTFAQAGSLGPVDKA